LRSITTDASFKHTTLKILDVFLPAAAGAFLPELDTTFLDGAGPCTPNRKQNNILGIARCYPHLPSN
jgi:hypothetical protein